jgi:mono/diheme cytochrome c family protein/glucose/arabinose dehydrogenase
MKNTSYILILLLTLLFNACSNEQFDEPKVSLKNYHIEKEFNLEAITSEPFIEAPVTIDFDNQGRIWVVEMRGYMQNLEGTGEDMPNGRITILEDLDKDGITDHAKVFLDSLVLPRAITHVYGGLLYAEPPNLWFVDIENDKPTNKILVDSHYTHGGNVEHQPNGLMMHLDNWIYNAKSNFRYQKTGNQWIKEKTFFRGQWGISKDNFGRIYYNNNSIQLKGDLILPNTSSKNQHLTPKASLGKILTPNQRVYPLHATSVNRGYIKGRLDKDSLLINITSACGPVIYRGNQFPPEYTENGFTCAPEANLIKRNILSFKTNDISAKQAIENKEFIASTDEGFRPVNIFNGPDGNLYIVDMHRGILQDKAFLTPYLKNHYARKKLDTIIGMGRILKVSAKNTTSNSIPEFENLNNNDLVSLLSHPNGWHRDKAQHMLIHKYEQTAIPLLKELIVNSKNTVTQLHALHTLNGLEALTFPYLNDILLTSPKTDLIIHTLVLIENFATGYNTSKFLKTIQLLADKNNPEIDLYLSNSLGEWTLLSTNQFFPILEKLSIKHQSENIFQEGIISSIRNNEEKFQQLLNQGNNHSKSLLGELITTTIENKNNANKKKKKKIKKNLETSIKSGSKIFKNICATCHGMNGQGIDNLAPPLKKSEYISDSPERLTLVLLHGLSGPIHVNGKSYDLGATMPGLNNNPNYSDKEILNLINYLQSEFSKTHKNIKASTIKSLRNEKPKSGVYTETELLKIK